MRETSCFASPPRDGFALIDQLNPAHRAHRGAALDIERNLDGWWAWHHDAMDEGELYGLPLERFVPERNALARRLRAEGDGAEAKRVAKLRKPSVAAWAVNQLVRTQRHAVDELLAAGDALERAQADVLAGRAEAASLRGAMDRQRAVVDGLLQAARGLLSAQGHELSGAVIERVGETLAAAALDEHARARVRDGRLERELRHVGLGVGAGAGTPRPRARRKSEPSPQLRAARARARREAERAEHALKAAEERREQAARALEQADEALAAARAAAEAHRGARDG